MTWGKRARTLVNRTATNPLALTNAHGVFSGRFHHVLAIPDPGLLAATLPAASSTFSASSIRLGPDARTGDGCHSDSVFSKHTGIPLPNHPGSRLWSSSGQSFRFESPESPSPPGGR